MSNAPFSNNNSSNNPIQTTLNIFLLQDNKNQKNGLNNGNPSQGQNSNNQNSSSFINFNAPSTTSSLNPFTSNFTSNNVMKINDNKKQEDNNPFNSFLNNKNSTNSNQNILNNNNKISTSLNISNNNNTNNITNNINNITGNNNSTNLNKTSNINTNNITSNNTNNNTKTNNAFDFFNVKNIQKNNESNINNANSNNKKEEKKESMNIFMVQSNNILNKLNNDKNNFDVKKENETQLNIDTSSNKNNNKNNILDNLLKNENESEKEKEEKEKADEFINNLFIEDKLFSTDKQLMEYEKSQLSYKINDDIINDFKNMLLTQKEKFSKLINTARILEEKVKQNNNLLKKNAQESFENQIKYEQISQKFKSLYQNSNNLRQNLSLKEKTMIDAINYIMNNDNRKNNINFNSLHRTNFDENVSCYKDMKETCEKVKKIDNDLMLISNSFIKNENNIINKNKEMYEIYKEKNKYNDEYYFNNKIKNEFSGVWLERNSENKIYMDQNIMNSLLSDCYNGLNNLKYTQDEFEFKYTKLKNKLINKINENNNISVINRDKYNNISNINNFNNININSDNNNNIMKINNDFI